ncbi:MAG TPA: hypothetical protein EYG57_15650 [Planctomycetes bacterium]|nr:hypothetical protein [Planctomycetota bacterium]
MSNLRGHQRRVYEFRGGNFLLMERAILKGRSHELVAQMCGTRSASVFEPKALASATHVSE